MKPCLHELHKVVLAVSESPLCPQKCQTCGVAPGDPDAPDWLMCVVGVLILRFLPGAFRAPGPPCLCLEREGQFWVAVEADFRCSRAYAKREELLQKDKFDQRQLLHCKARRGEFNTKDGISSTTGSGDSPHPGSILGWGCLAYAQREALLQDAKITMRNYKMS